MTHTTPACYLDRNVSVVLIGCGGNGSQMLTGLARLNHAITALGHPGLDVIAFDPDTVSEANMGRQMFSPADVGLSKSVVLVNRVNQFFGLDWDARAVAFGERECNGLHNTIVIMCVDSAKARATIADGLRLRRFNGYLLDLGNRASDGQVVFGQLPLDTHVVPDKTAQDRLPSPYALLPELVDITRPDDDTPSCGLAEALERQELFVNQAIVTPALAILWEFFRHGQLTWHGAFVNLKTGHTRPLLVEH